MKKQLLNKFYAFIVTAMMFSVSANAQIVYTDVVPDSIINSTDSVYHLDLNNDGVTDYNINFTTGVISGQCNGIVRSVAYYVKITPLDSNEVGTDATSPFYPKVLLLDSVIDSAAFAWKNTANQLLAEKLWHCLALNWIAYYDGSWNNTTSKYLPLRLHVGSQVYYGWFRLSVASGVINATIFDYAYNSSPGQPILAGQTTATGITEIQNPETSIIIYPNPFTSQTTIAFNEEQRKTTIKITDVLGQEIKTINFTGRQLILDKAEMKAGIYFVQTTDEQKHICTRKIIIQ